MKIERINAVARMSKIVRYGGVVYLSGQVGEGNTVEEQTLSCLGRVAALLDEAGSSLENILQATIWLTDIGDYAAMNSVWDHWFPAGCAPARSCGESRLNRPELKVEITVIAAVAE